MINKECMNRTLYLKEQDNLLSLAASKRFTDYNKVLCNELGFYSDGVIKIVGLFSPLIFILLILCSFFYYLCCFFKAIIRYSFTEFKKRSQGEISGPVFLCYTPLLEQRLKATDIDLKDARWIIGPGIKLSSSEGKIIEELGNTNFMQTAEIYVNCLKVLWDYILSHKSLYPIHKAWSFYEQKELLLNKLKDADLFFSNQCDRWALLFDELPAKTLTLVQHGITFSTPLPWRLKNIHTLYTFSERAAKEICLSTIDGQPDIRVMSPTISLTDISSESVSILLISHINYFSIEKNIIQEICSLPNVEVFVKKHPTLTNYSCYNDLQKEYGFHLIVDTLYPRVDYVVSYFSTLAYEYMAYNIPVYVYKKEEDCDIKQIKSEIYNFMNI